MLLRVLSAGVTGGKGRSVLLLSWVIVSLLVVVLPAAAIHYIGSLGAAADEGHSATPGRG